VARPNGWLDAMLERNENSIARARRRQDQYDVAICELMHARADMEQAQKREARALKILCSLHGDDESLCRRLRAENARSSIGAVA